MHTEHKTVARLYADCITDVAGLSESITLREVRRQNRRSMYVVHVDGEADRLETLAYYGHKEGDCKIHWDRISEECRPAFLCGIFLACGTVGDPEKGYRAEFATPLRELSDGLETLLTDCIGPPKRTVRRNDYVLYYKESEYIEDLITFIGAPKASLRLMEVKIVKDVRNHVNRATNCETANISKTVDAAMTQGAAIEKIERIVGLEALDEDLRELAMLRRENPELSLRELGESLQRPISRSGVNHRMKRILEFSEKL